MYTQPTDTEPELCLSVSCRGTGQQWPATGALGAADPGMAETFLTEGTINPIIEPQEFTQDWGNRLFKGTNKPFMHQESGERSSDLTSY